MPRVLQRSYLELPRHRKRPSRGPSQPQGGPGTSQTSGGAGTPRAPLFPSLVSDARGTWPRCASRSLASPANGRDMAALKSLSWRRLCASARGPGGPRTKVALPSSLVSPAPVLRGQPPGVGPWRGTRGGEGAQGWEVGHSSGGSLRPRTANRISGRGCLWRPRTRGLVSHVAARLHRQGGCAGRGGGGMLHPALSSLLWLCRPWRGERT